MSGLSAIAKIGTSAAAGGMSMFGSQDAEAMFLGRGAKMADKAMHKSAQKMSDEGHNPKEIFKKTGWFKDPVDRQWKWEISDKDADWKGGEKGFTDWAKGSSAWNEPLDSSFTHDLLKENYPDLMMDDLSLATNPNHKGYFDPNTGEIGINPKLHNRNSSRSTMLHELQHKIQKNEGFARGSSPSNFNWESANDIADQASELRGKMKIDGISFDEREKLSSEISRLLNGYDDATPSGNYKRVGGEVESRNVQHRDRLQKLLDDPATKSDLTLRDFDPLETSEYDVADIYEDSTMSPSYKWPGRPDPKKRSPYLSKIDNIADIATHGSIKPTAHPTVSKIAQGFSKLGKTFENHPLGLVLPGQGTSNWLQKLANQHEPTWEDRAGALMDWL